MAAFRRQPTRCAENQLSAGNSAAVLRGRRYRGRLTIQAQNVFIPYDLVVLMRAMFNVEHMVRTLDPDFQLLENLQTKGPEVLKAAMERGDWKGAIDRLKLDALAATQDLPAVLGSWTRRLNQESQGLGLSMRLQGLDGLEAHLDRSSTA